MIFMDKLVNSAKKISGILAKNLKEVKAIVIAGSVGRGFSDRYSDVDLTVYVNKIPSKTKRKKLWESFDIKRDDHPFDLIDILTIHNEKVEVMYEDFNSMNKKVKVFKEGNRKVIDDLATDIINTKILYDPKNLIKNWKRKLKKYPDKIGEDIIRELQEVVNIFKLLKNPILRKDWVYVNFGIGKGLKSLWLSWFALNKIPEENAPKWAKQKLKKLKIKPKNAYKKLEEISKLGNRKTGFEKKLNLLSDLCLETLKLSKKYYPKVKFEENFYKKKWYDERIKECLDCY
jgi:predicted nucleotidyltransferase